MFRSILVPIDGSDHAARALEEAIDLARATGAALTVMTCVPDVTSWTIAGASYAGEQLQQLVEQSKSEHRALLDAAVESAPDEVAAQAVLAVGPQGPAIVEQVEAGRHDLVVMGSRGRGDVTALLLGSVSHHVLHVSSAAVLIVHSQRHA